MDGRQERIGTIGAENFQTYADFVLETLKCTGREILMSTQGSCMSPLIESGDRLVVRLVDPHEVKFGDIITFHADNRVFAHRCIKKRKENGLWFFCQKGDRVSAWNWIPETQVIGKVEAILKGKSIIELSRWKWVVVNRIRAFGAVFWIVSRTVYHLLSNSIDRLLNKQWSKRTKDFSVKT